MRRGFGGLHRKDLMVKLRQARLRRAHLRQAMAQRSGQAVVGGMRREKRMQRIQQALAARKERLNRAIARADEAEERISQRARKAEEQGAERGVAQREGGAPSGMNFERRQKAVEAHKEKLDRLMRHHEEVEAAFKQRLQNSRAQVRSLYDPTEITAEQEELEAEEEDAGSDDTGSDGGGQRSMSASKSSKGAAKKGRKGH